MMSMRYRGCRGGGLFNGWVLRVRVLQTLAKALPKHICILLGAHTARAESTPMVQMYVAEMFCEGRRRGEASFRAEFWRLSGYSACQ